MKTPRELLLHRHAPVVAKLHDVRARVLEEIAPRRSGWLAAWEELFWSCRRAWLGMGAVWVVLLLVNMVFADRTPATAAVTVASSPESRRLLAEQRQLRAELLDLPAAPQPAEPPRPRSEWRRAEMVG